MRNFVSFIIWVIVFGACYAGFQTFWPDIKFSWLTHNGDSPHLVLSGDQVYISDNVGVYAYQSDWPATSTTSDEARYQISWSFINEVSEWFTLSASWDAIMYQWHPKRIRYVMSWYGASDTSATTFKIGVKYNWNILTWSIAIWRSAWPAYPIWVLSISQAIMNSWDTIQLVISSDKNANLTPEIITTYASSLF